MNTKPAPDYRTPAMNRKRIFVPGFVLAGFLVLMIWKSREAAPAKAKPDFSAVALTGRYLFFDTRLSFNNTKSCASCHDPKFAFSDGYRRSITAGGEIVLHNAPSLINVSALNFFDWAEPNVTTLEKQHVRPLFGEHPVEMGARGNETVILGLLQSDTLYQRLFKAAFPSEKNAFTFPHVIQSLAEYVRTLKSLDAPYDRFVSGEHNALSESAQKGMKLFFSSALQCASCHVPPYFTLAATTKDMNLVYANTGLYVRYPVEDQGVFSVSGIRKGSGKFKIPSLRNVSVTAPYMHDGSISSLDEVIEIYARGGREIVHGPWAGDGKKNSYKDRRITGFSISEPEKEQLIDFLFTLTDSTIFVNPSFQNPFRHARP